MTSERIAKTSKNFTFHKRNEKTSQKFLKSQKSVFLELDKLTEGMQQSGTYLFNIKNIKRYAKNIY